VTVTYRDATLADAALLADIGRATFTETFGHLYEPADLQAFLASHTPAAWQAELADRNYAVLLVEADGEAIGYAKLGPPKLPFTPADDAIELRQFYVRVGHQGSGVAARMMDWAIAEARRRGVASVYLSVFVDNERARRFYRRYGFDRVGSYVFMVGSHGDEDDVMRLQL
jgi:ribosomal protein S18 acetylase RimI-like enzyme